MVPIATCQVSRNLHMASLDCFGSNSCHDEMLDLSGTFCLVSSSIETLGHT